MDSTILAAIAALMVGMLAFLANPPRLINRVFLSATLNVVLWLWSLGNAFSSADGVFWLRLSSTLGTGIFLHVWGFLEAARFPNASRRERFQRSLSCLIIAGILAILPATEAFIPPASQSDNRIYGPAYFGYIGLGRTGYLTLLVLAIRALRGCTGAQRLEIHILLFGGCATAPSSIGLIAASALFDMSYVVRFVPIGVITFLNPLNRLNPLVSD